LKEQGKTVQRKATDKAPILIKYTVTQEAISGLREKFASTKKLEESRFERNNTQHSPSAEQNSELRSIASPNRRQQRDSRLPDALVQKPGSLALLGQYDSR
uniref:DUF5734 domain-containing protein n=1 Tax=Heligmosomoides polygyrus TaxID=6339 RepID=A0A183F9A7_HELPZ